MPPELGSGGHVHYIELDQFVGPNYLVTCARRRSTRSSHPTSRSSTTGRCCTRIERTRFTPHSPLELSYSIGSALVRREIDLVAALAPNRLAEAA